MKKVLIYLFAISWSYFCYAQQIQRQPIEKLNISVDQIRYSGLSSNPTYIKFDKGKEPLFQNFKEWLQTMFNTGQDFDIKMINQESDELNFNHYRFVQTYQNIPIREAVFIVHVKDGKVISYNGNIFSNPQISNQYVISENQALSYALNYVNAQEYMWQNEANNKWLRDFYNDPEKTYFPEAVKEIMYIAEKKSFVYVYKFDIYANVPLSRQNIYIEAETGKVVKSLNTLHTGNSNGTAVTKYSGTRPITTDSVSPTQFRLRETGRGNGIRTYNMQQQTNYGSAVDFVDSDNYWNNVNSQIDEAAGDAHWGAEMTYDYFYLIHNRNSIDNNGFALYSYIHYDVNYANAFWDGQRMTYGDGNNNKPFCALDICAHEVTHGLTTFTCDLDYSGESGALNEGFSDIFSTTVEFYAKPTAANWTCGEDIGMIIRNIQNPNATQNPDTYLGTYWDPGNEVHQNSTVFSHWFYRVCQGGSGTNDIGNSFSVNGIGMTKAAKIAFRMQTVYLTNTSDYADARFYAIIAATDLYGGCSPEVASVTNAMYAVGIGSAYVPNVTVNFTAKNNISCSAPQTVLFYNSSSNATNYIWHFGDGTTSTNANPSHIYSSPGNYTVKLIASSTGCGTDSLIKTSYVSIASTNSNYATMPETGTGPTLNCCTGTLFDSGENSNYSDNTNGTITIAPAGASSVTLTFNSFNFESGYDYLYIYNGPNTSSPLIGQYDGTSLPNGGIIQSTGSSITLRQSTDGGVVAAGFKLTWQCSLPSSPPVCSFNANETSTCSGVVQFNDWSTNAATSWLWNFGDGTTSTLQNPIHAYTSNGTYTVKLKASNNFGTDSITKPNYITVNNLPTPPVTTGDTVCTGSPAILSAQGLGQIEWFNSPLGGNAIYVGSVFTTPALTANTTYYAQDKGTTPTLYVGKTNNSGSGGYFGSTSNVHYLIFNCYTPAKLISVKVYADADGNRTILLRDTNQNILSSANVFVPQGESRVTLNFSLPVANSLQLVGAGVPNLYRNNNNSATFPYIQAGLVKITESSASKPPYSSPGNYYYFYDWEIKANECISPRVGVVAKVIECSNIEENEGYFEVNSYPNPANDLLNIEFNVSELLDCKLSLYDMPGKLVFQDEVVIDSYHKVYKVALENFNPGIYFIHIQNKKIHKILKLVIN